MVFKRWTLLRGIEEVEGPVIYAAIPWYHFWEKLSRIPETAADVLSKRVLTHARALLLSRRQN
jgi:hypothetical protein